MIEIKNLSKVFQAGTDVAALNGIDLTVEDGDIYGIIGMSGAGKSTLLRCISLLETPTTGTISVDGQELSQLRGRDLRDLRKQVGVIFQGYNLLMQRTVTDNIAFPMELSRRPKAEIQARCRELLEIVSLSDKAQMYPSQLSGGQRQRVAIARALANHPKVLLCDEPTSALDPMTTRSILDLLEDINRKLGVTVIIITHELGVVRAICNKVAVIDQGRIVERGQTQTVLDHPQSPITQLLLQQANQGGVQ